MHHRLLGQWWHTRLVHLLDLTGREMQRKVLCQRRLEPRHWQATLLHFFHPNNLALEVRTLLHF
jgi:hypothetical protein